jgi:hypothetical protein
MNIRHSKSILARLPILFMIVMIALSGLACSFSLAQWPFGQAAGSATPSTSSELAPTPRAQITFNVSLPAPLDSGQTLAISVLDEVTGLSLNATNYPMQAIDDQTYTATLPLPLQAVIKYRYQLLGTAPAQEDTRTGEAVHYRLYYITGPGEVQDVISGWTGQPSSGSYGTIQGQVVGVNDGIPQPNILVAAGGAQSLTDSQGRFDLEGIPPGTHNMVAYALDGTFQTFQQGAKVAEGLTTPVKIQLQQAKMVKVTFTAKVPSNTLPGAPIRLAGNLLQLGNTFANLRGGMNSLADRMPVLSLLSDGRYSVTLSLPAGAYLHYKYTLGDGFWNAEHLANGEFQLRELVIPDADTTLQDTVETWQAGSSAPITFRVSVPASTPAGDTIYIQFNPYGWTEPIPMWPLGNNQWSYKLYSPLNLVSNFGYRYCRNGQCGSADDQATIGESPPGRPVSTSLAGGDIQDTVTDWAWMQSTEETTVVGADVGARQAGFMAGIEFQPNYSPSWSPFIGQSLQNVKALGSNWVVLDPSWTYTLQNPLVFEPLPRKDPLWTDAGIMVSQARAQGLNVAIFPNPQYPTEMADWWQKAPRSNAWWKAWFDRYREFAVNYADLATQTGAQALILGGEGISPALPGGQLPGGGDSGVPLDAESRWSSILGDVRTRFSGSLLWAYPYTPGELDSAPDFLQEADGVYLLWSAALSHEDSPSKAEITAKAGKLLDHEVASFQSSLKKPLILALAYPSAAGSATGCLSDGSDNCLDWQALSRPKPDINSVTLNLGVQSDLYEAVLNAINTRPWVAGIVSRGFYPPVALEDKSASVHGKPAADILWYWFPRLLGVVK